MMEERQSSSPLLRRRPSCDLSIQGEAIGPSPPPQSAGHKQRTGEVDIETVYETCASLAASATARARSSKAGVDQRTCRRSGPAYHTERSQWDFDPFLKDDTGRMISTKTPVAKMTAPVSMVKVPRVKRTVTVRQSTDKSDANDSSGKPENTEEVAAAEQAGRLDEDNSSNTTKQLAAAVANPGSVVKAPRVYDDRNGSLEKIQCDKEGPDKKRLGDIFDKNNSSNKSQNLAAAVTTPASAVKAPRGDVARKLRRKVSSEKLQGDKEGADTKQLGDRFDQNNLSNKSQNLVAAVMTPASAVEAPRGDVARKSHSKVSSEKLQGDKEGADKKQLADRFDKNNSSNKSQNLVTAVTTPPRGDVARKSHRNGSAEILQHDKEVAVKKQLANRSDKNYNSSNKAKMARRSSVAKDRRMSIKSNKTEENEDELNLAKYDLERSASLATYLLQEDRRSTSLQVRH